MMCSTWIVFEMNNVGGMKEETDLVHEDLGTRVQTGCDRVVERVFEPLLFSYDAIQKISTVDMWGL